jgi:hypothetical protein
MLRQKLVAFWLALGAFVAADSADAVLKTIVVQGDVSPNAGAPYRRPNSLAVSDFGGQKIAFYSPTEGGSRCIFLVDTAGNPGSLLVCERDSSPDGRRYSKLSTPSINVAGVPAFSSRTTFGFDGVYRGAPPAVVALTNDPLGPQFLDNMSNVVITDAGDVVFLTQLTGGAPGDTALLRCSGGDGNCSPNTIPPGTGTLTTLARPGDSIPDRAGREICALIAARASSFGVVFSASTKLDCNNNAETEAVGIFRRAFAGAIATVALSGETSSIPPTSWSSFRGVPAITNNGKVGFQAGLLGTPSAGLFLCDPATCPAASPTVAVTVGEEDAPGSGTVFRTFSAPSVSDAGDLAFVTRLSTLNGSSNAVYIWRAASDTFTAVAAKFDSVPSIAGAVFTTFLVGPPSMTPGGDVAFKARIKRSIAPRNRTGIFIEE